MREKINRLARGVIEREAPIIEITPAQITQTVSNGRVNKAELLLKSGNRKFFRGLIYVSNPRVKVLSPYFAGTQVYIGYNVDCAGLSDGDQVTGRFEIVSNAGEFTVPFTFTAEAQTEQPAQAAVPLEEEISSDNFAGSEWSIEEKIFEGNDIPASTPENTEEEETRAIIEEVKEKYDKLLGEMVSKENTGRFDDAAGSELLLNICEALINARRHDNEAFVWYKRAVAEDVSQVGLYDCYLAALPDNYSEILPREIYMYFSFNPPANDADCKKLYKSVVRHFNTTSPTYLQLEGQMRQFAIRQIMDKRIDEDLAEIYLRFLSPDMVDERMAGILPDLLITYRLDVPAGYTRVIVNYDEINGDQVVAAADGKAYFPLYTRRYHITVMDRLGHKKVLETPSLKRLLPHTNDILDECTRLVPTLPAYKIALAHKLSEIQELTKEQFDMLMEMADDPGISKSFKKEIKGSVIRGYNWAKFFSDRPVLLRLADEKDLPAADRAALLNHMLIAGYTAEAESEIRRSGYENIDPHLLMQVCENAIENARDEEDEFLLYMTYYVYKHGSAGPASLKYLARYYNGLSDDMLEILRDALAVSLPVYDLPERLLGQLLFVNRTDRLDLGFRLYAENCSVDRTLLKAYYSVKSHFYFMDGEPLDEELFEAVKSTLAPEILAGTVPVIIQLAISRYCSEKESLSETDMAICRTVLMNLCQKGIIFSYFKNFAKVMPLPEEIKDKTMVYYRGNDGESVALIITPEDDEEEPVYMEMTYVYEGLFVKSILLYEGECEHYEIRVTDSDGNSRIVKEGELKAEIYGTQEDRRFTRLNSLIRGSESPSDPEWQRQMSDYAFDDTLNGLLFK